MTYDRSIIDMIFTKYILVTSVFAFMALQIYLPKNLFFGTPIYIFTVNYLLILTLLLTFGKVTIKTNIEKTYYAYSFACIIWALAGGISHQVAYSEIFSLLIKYLIPITVFSSIYYMKSYIKLNILNTLYISQVLFIITVGTYVLYNHIIYPQNIIFLSGSYTQEYRLIGFTGHTLSGGALQQIGTTSVSMGVYVAFILFLSMQRLADNSSVTNSLVTIALFVCLMLTYSRAGLLAFFPGVIVYLVLNRNRKFILVFLIVIISLIVYVAIQYDLVKILSSLGGLGKIISIFQMEQSGTYVNTRTQMWIHGYNFIINNPLVIFTGVGYGELLVEQVTGIAFYESAFFQTFMEMGIIGFLLLSGHFLAIILFISNSLRREKDIAKLWVIKSYAYFMPGFILSNTFGANMLQTDFIAPLFYGFLAVCYNIQKPSFKLSSLRPNP